MKKKVGPNTAMGKAIASQNSLKHGLTSNRPSSSSEKEAYTHYLTELNHYYQPQNPIEQLQLERIAMCKIKLDRLYALENAQLTIAIAKFEREPDLVLDQIAAASGVVRGMVKELIKFSKVTLPCRLSATALTNICEELEEGGRGPVKLTDAEIESHYPQLAKFLRGYYAVNLSIEEDLLVKLRHASESITKAIEDGTNYSESIKKIFDRLFQEKIIMPRQEETPSAHVLELEQMIKEQQEVYDQQQRHKKPKEPPKQPDTSMKRAQFEKYTQVFLDLRGALATCKEVHEHFLKTKELMAKAVTLPQSESDLLMRYQTTLERRLSSAIGELLLLQGRRLPHKN